MRLDGRLRLSLTQRALVLVLSVQALVLEEVFHAFHQSDLLVTRCRLRPFVDKVRANFGRFYATSLPLIRNCDVLQNYSIDTYQ